METVSKILAYHLKKWRITHVFGIPGKPITPLILELDKQGIQFVLSKHECGAGFEAAGYALTSKSLGVALVTAGPGGTNMLTAAGQALATQSPVLFLTGQPPIREIGKVLGQDSTMFGTDLVKMFEQVTKFSARVERGDLFETYFKHAMQRAFTGVRGPVHLSIPLDVFAEEVKRFELELPLLYPQVQSTNLDEVIEIMLKAKRPVLFVGGGVHANDAYEELIQVAEQLNIPVMTTPSGKGVFASGHRLSLGAFGLGGSQASEDYMREGIDVMVVIGSQLSDLEVPGLPPSIYPEQIIQFDFEPTFIGKTIPVPTIPVLGDLKCNLQEIISRTKHAAPAGGRSWPAVVEERPPSRGLEYMPAQLVMEILRSELPDDAVMFGDAGSHSFYAIKYFDIVQPGTFFFEEVFASMGRAIGYAVGAQIAAPEKKIVCLTGDGCMFMTGTEVSTAVNYQAPVIFVVLNNASLDMVEKGMAKHLGRAVGTNYQVPLQIAKFGESMGAEGFRCRTEEELRDALLQALINERVNVIEVMVDPQEVPPTMKRG
jgi:acetolactate synthase-1/2/3 large subunit